MSVTLGDRVAVRPPPIRGRAVELDVLRAFVDRLAAGIGSVTVVTGDAGIGKSLLVRQACDWASARGIAVHVGAGEEWGRDRPFGPLSGAFDLTWRSDDERRRTIAARLIGAGAVTATGPAGQGARGSMRLVVHEEILDLVEQLALDGPLLLAFDDLQWADMATLAAVAALCHRSGDLALGLLVAMRPHPRVPSQFDHALGATGASRLALGPLDACSVDELVADHIGVAPGERLRGQLGGAGGNPFFVIEVVRTLHAEGHLDVAGGRAESALVGMPPTVRQAILRRVRSLSPSAVELLRGAAVLGGHFDVELLAEVLGANSAAVRRDIDEAMAVGLVDDAAPELRIRHDLIREAVYADSPVAIRRSLHRRAAVAASRAGRSPVTIVEHLALSRGGDNKLPVVEPAALLRAAAAELADGDPSAAADLLGRAGATIDSNDESNAELAADRVTMLTASGRLADAGQIGRIALARAPTAPVERRLRVTLAEVELLRGDAPAAIDELEVARRLGELSDADEADLDARLASACLAAFDLDGAQRSATAAERWATKHSDGQMLANALAVRCRLAAYAAAFDSAVELGRAAVAAADARTVALHGDPQLHLGLAYSNAGRPDEAIAVLEEGRRQAERAGLGWAIARYHAALVLVGLHAGRWDDALAEASAVRSLFAEGVTRASIVEVEAMCGIIHFHRGEHDEAGDALGRARAERRRRGADRSGVVWTWWLQALLAEAEGDLTGATQRLGRAFTLAVETAVSSVQLWWGPELARLAVASGDGDRASQVASELDRIAVRAPSPTATAAATRARGTVTGDPAVLAQAVEHARRIPRPLDLVRACEAAAAAPRVDPALAVGWLNEALAITDRIGAGYDAARIRARLRALGVRTGVRGPRRRPCTGIGSLTPTERRVLAVVGEGLTNAQIADRLFISRRTAETHVAHLYRKLEVRGRIALARLANELGVERRSERGDR